MCPDDRHSLPIRVPINSMTLQSEDERELRASILSPRTLLFGIGIALIAYLCWRILLPFLPAVCWALALAIIAEPMRAWLSRKSVPPSVTAVIVIVLVLTAVIGPETLLARVLAGEASDAIAGTKKIWDAIERSPVLGPALRRLDSEFDLSKEAVQLASGDRLGVGRALRRRRPLDVAVNANRGRGLCVVSLCSRWCNDSKHTALIHPTTDLAD